jgi:hypothetical protein
LSKNIFLKKKISSKNKKKKKNISVTTLLAKHFFAQQICWSNKKQIWTKGPIIAAEGCL